MKLVKHTFKESEGTLEIIDDEVIEKKKETTLCFSLPMSALGLFEEEYGKPLVDVIINNTRGRTKGDELDSIEFSRALASSMYLKIENGKVTNDDASKEEFKNMELFKSVASDLPLRIALVNCAIECLNDENTPATKGGSKSKK